METIISQPKTITAATATSPSPSCTPSPSHEFSFTISFHPSPLPVSNPVLSSNSNTTAVDLSPADDIFFHGHLLPLQLLSHPPRHPPPTTIPQFSTSQPLIQTPNPNNNNNTLPPPPSDTNKEKGTSKTISNPFYSLFSGRAKTRKQVMEEEDKKKRTFDVGRLLKKYVLLLEALFSRGGNKEKRDLRRRPCSFSVNSNWKGKEEWIEKKRKRWGQLSAPASMRSSPTNSGLLFATGPNAVCGGSSEESTMEELQNAIQAAIAHCKNSIAMKEEQISV